MKLTNLQRIILIAYAIVIVNICIFFAPKSLFMHYEGNYIVRYIEYSPIWHNSNYYETRVIKRNKSQAEISDAQKLDTFIRVDYYRLATEVFATTVVAGVLYIIVSPKKEDKHIQSQHLSDF